MWGQEEEESFGHQETKPQKMFQDYNSQWSRKFAFILPKTGRNHTITLISEKVACMHTSAYISPAIMHLLYMYR